MTHVVDRIADALVDLLTDNTTAETLTRDRPPAENFSVGDLDSIDVRIGEDEPLDGQFTGKWRSSVAINVDLYAKVGDCPVSQRLMELRSESYRATMVAIPALSAVADVISILPGGAEEILIAEQGELAVGYLRTVFFVTYQHSLTDPDQ